MPEPVDRSADFLRLTPVEQALSLPLQFSDAPVVDAGHGTVSARAEIESLLRPAVVSERCYVLFSGGRDSSALLAVATHLARRAGVADPVPVTVVHADAADADESSWQDLVLEHLKLPDRIVLRFRGDQTLLSRVARQGLARHGVVWPEAVQLHGAVYEQLEPGFLVTGEGGDQVIVGHRMTAFQTLGRLGWRDTARTVLPALVPRPVFRRWLRAQLDPTALPWLTPTGSALVGDAIAYAGSEPLSWRRAVLGSLAGRPEQVFTVNFETAIREYDLEPVNPFLAPSFLSALAAEGGLLGLGGRTDLMRHLFGDLLPDVVLARSSKAAFNQTRWGEQEREFARAWAGAGIDDALVDGERLRDAWLSDDPPPGADFQLHAAWCASAAGSPVGETR